MAAKPAPKKGTNPFAKGGPLAKKGGKTVTCPFCKKSFTP
jgi:hypothetical protein